MRHALPLLALLAACRDEPPHVAAYYGAVCRLLTEPTCLDSQDGSCSYTLAYPSEAACMDDMLDRVGRRCLDDAEAAVEALGDEYDACLTSLDELVCETDDVCLPSPVFVAGPCARVYEATLTCSE